MGAFEDAVKKKEDEIRLRAKIPAPVSPEIEGAPNANMTLLGPSNKPAQPPKASVQGVSNEMVAEYIPPATKPRVAASAQTGPSLAAQAASRLLRADTEFKRIAQKAKEASVYPVAAGTGLGTAVGAGLGGPVGAMLGAPLGQMAGIAAGALADSSFRPVYDSAEKEYKDAQKALRKGLDDKLFTVEELEAALGPEWTVYR